MNTPGLYVVQCRAGEDRGDFPGLTINRAKERCEAERAGGRWASVVIRSEDTGEVVNRYYGAGAVKTAVKQG